jgi:predicted nucleic acid-binding protein
MVNDLRRLATVVDDLPDVEVSTDPYDNFLLAMAQVAQADMLVTGDQRGLLALHRHLGTQILSARDALERLQLNK